MHLVLSMEPVSYATTNHKYSVNGPCYQGYCDAQCARDLKFIDGKANAEGWQPSSNDANAGVGQFGACW